MIFKQHQEDHMQIQNIPLNAITLTKHNPRRILPEDPGIKELAESIKQSGLLQPVVCRPLNGGEFELLAGARRYYAHKLLGSETITAIVRSLTDVQAIEVTVLENLQRENLSPIEEARGVQSLLDSGHSVDLIAEDLGKSRAWVMRRAKLVDLDPEVIQAVEETENDWSRASAGHLEMLARLPVARQRELIDNEMWLATGTLQQMKHHLERDEMLLSAAPWDHDDMTIGLPACSACKDRTDVQPDLFDADEVGKFSRCLDPECWARKLKAHLAKAVQTQKDKLGESTPVVSEDYGIANMVKTDYRSYDIDFAKKTDPKAVPVIVVGQGGKVETKYAILRASKGSPVSKAANRPTPQQKTQAEYVERMVKALDDMKSTPVGMGVYDLIDLTVAFGTHNNAQYRSSEAWKKWDNFVAASQQSWKSDDDRHAYQAEIRDALWRCITPVLAYSLRFQGIVNVKPAYENACRIATLAGLTNPEKTAPKPTKTKKGKAAATASQDQE